jgi:hypothetical protein
VIDVEIWNPTPDEFERIFNLIMEEHKDALDQLAKKSGD